MSAPRTAGAVVRLDELVAVAVRPVPSALDHFATEDGRILSCARAGVLRERRPCPSPRGYMQLVVTRGEHTIGHPVHRMVAEAFHGPKPSPLHEVRHLDGDKLNNCAGNLAWGTHVENIDDRTGHGTTASGARNGAYTSPEHRPRGEANGRAVLSAEQVAEIRRRLDARERRADIARDLGLRWNVVDRIARGVTWAIAEEDARRETTGSSDHQAA